MIRLSTAITAAAVSGALLAADYNPELPWKYDVSGREAEKSMTSSGLLSVFDGGSGQSTGSGLSGVEACGSWFLLSDPFDCHLAVPGLLLMFR
jgi:hypothetical protein